MGDRTEGDDDLLDRLRDAVLAADPVPDAVRAAGRAALGWRDLDARLAELVTDSALAAAPVRARPHTPRILTFSAPGTLLEVQVAGPSDQRELTGRIAPRPDTDVQIHWPGGHLTVHADLAGHFFAPQVPCGPISVRFRAAGGGTVSTSWMRI